MSSTKAREEYIQEKTVELEGLSVRTRNLLFNENIFSKNDVLIAFRENRIKNIYGVGKKIINEISEWLNLPKSK